jgi:hypothetical protein
VCGVAVACEVYEVDTEPACELRRRSATAHAGVVVDGDAVPEGEIDAHHDTCIVAEGVLGVGGQAGAVGSEAAVCLALDDRDQELMQHPAAVGHSQLAAGGVADDCAGRDRAPGASSRRDRWPARAASPTTSTPALIRDDVGATFPSSGGEPARPHIRSGLRYVFHE